MHTTPPTHRNPAPVPDAYDGFWLELLENPAAAPSGAGAAPSGDGECGDGASGAGGFGPCRAD